MSYQTCWTRLLKYALVMAKKYDAEQFALTIINTRPWFYSSTLYGWASSETMEKVHENDIHRAQTWLDQVKENASDNEVRLQTKISLVPYTETSTAGAITNYVCQEIQSRAYSLASRIG